MKSVDQHVEVSVVIKGDAKVSFVTEYGWASNIEYVLDMCGWDDAKESAIDILSDLQVVPFENNSLNEGYVDEATSVINDFILCVKNLTIGKEVTLEPTDAIIIKMKFKETYEVHFGEESVA